MRKLRDEMYDYQSKRAQVIAVQKERIVDDKKEALIKEGALQHELLKIKKDQEIRRK